MKMRASPEDTRNETQGIKEGLIRRGHSLPQAASSKRCRETRKDVGPLSHQPLLGNQGQVGALLCAPV